jgi:fumarate reductase flavoprotein subunit
MEMNRRDFLKMGAAGVGVATMTGMVACSPAPTGDEGNGGTVNAADIKWDKEADIVVVGGGGAGYAAAVEAMEAGASVIVLEKTVSPGGNTRLSAGMILGVHTEKQKEIAPWWTKGDSIAKFTEEMLAWGSGEVDADKVTEMCEASTEHIQWMMDMGREFDVCDILPPIHGFDSDDTWAPRSFHNETLSTGHFDAIRDKALTFGDLLDEQTETEGKHLILNADNEVVGVEAERDGTPLYYKARKGVLIATAGPDFGKDLTRTYNRQMYWGSIMAEKGYDQSVSRGTQANTGDGIRMGMEIGADVKMSTACVMSDSWSFGGVGYFGVYYEPENIYHNTHRQGAIYVNSKGNRFVQEDAHWGFNCAQIYHEIVISGADAINKEPNVWVITDSVGYANFYNMGLGIDPNAEVTAGRSFRADTLEDLAGQIEIESPVALRATVDRFNAFVDAGEDLDFHRSYDLTAKIETGPFYAIRSVPIVMGCAGGLAINSDTQVLDVNGEPIPRLYAAGMASGGWIGPFYNACGWAVLGTVHWGRKAGKNIAALETWE